MNRLVFIVRSVYALLTPSDRRRALVVLALMAVGMILETLGIGLVVPAIALLVGQDLAVTYPALAAVVEALGNPSRERLVMFGMLALVAIYVVKGIFLGFLSLYQNRFAFALQEHTSLKLVDAYLHQPYAFHLQRNSAQLIRNVVSEVNRLWFLVLHPTMLIFSEGLVLLGVACLLLVFEPLGAVMLAVILGVGTWAFHHATRPHLAHLGQLRQDHDGYRIQQLQEGLGGVKEVKLLGREASVLAKYGRHNAESARVERVHATLLELPRLWIEILAVAGLAALVLAMLARGQTAAAIVPTLGLFAAAAFRALPSAHRIVAGFHNLQYGAPIVTTINEELKLAAVPRHESRARADHPSFTRDIQLTHVDYAYPEAGGPALTAIDIAIRRGESVGFVGPSGAGKSTLVDIVLGLLTPSGGRVSVDGRDIQDDLRGWQRQIGYVPQSTYLSDDTLRNNVAFGLPRHEIDEAAVERAIAAAQLDTFVAALPAGLETLVGERGVRLSGGQRQRIGIARALYHEPAVLVLDEATSALDRVTEQGVMDSVAALRGKTVIVVSHRFSTVEHCDRLYRLERGRITAEGIPADLLGAPGAV